MKTYQTYQTYQTYHIHHTQSGLTTNPNEYGYFCDPELDINTNPKYKKHPTQYYSYNNNINTIYENDIENDIESTKYIEDTNNIFNRYNKYNKHNIYCMNSVIYGFIIIGSMTITTLLVKHNLI